MYDNAHSADVLLNRISEMEVPFSTCSQCSLLYTSVCTDINTFGSGEIKEQHLVWKNVCLDNKAEEEYCQHAASLPVLQEHFKKTAHDDHSSLKAFQAEENKKSSHLF